MTQAVNVRPGTVTAAQVIIWVVSALAALGSLLMLVLGVIGLVSGASVASSAAGTEASGLGTAFGGLIGFFSGGLIVVAVISLAFVGLWFWIASALGRGSRAARVVATVFCGIDLVWGLIALLGSLADRGGAPVLAALLALVIPATLMALLWGAESSRRFFDGVPSSATPAPMSPPVGFAQPQYGRPQYDRPQYGRPPFPQQQWSRQQFPEGVTAPMRLPAPRCGTCQAELHQGWAHCGACGASVTPPRPVGA